MNFSLTEADGQNDVFNNGSRGEDGVAAFCQHWRRRGENDIAVNNVKNVKMRSSSKITSVLHIVQPIPIAPRMKVFLWSAIAAGVTIILSQH